MYLSFSWLYGMVFWGQVLPAQHFLNIFSRPPNFWGTFLCSVHKKCGHPWYCKTKTKFLITWPLWINKIRFSFFVRQLFQAFSFVRQTVGHIVDVVGLFFVSWCRRRLWRHLVESQVIVEVNWGQGIHGDVVDKFDVSENNRVKAVKTIKKNVGFVILYYKPAKIINWLSDLYPILCWSKSIFPK